MQCTDYDTLNTKDSGIQLVQILAFIWKFTDDDLEKKVKMFMLILCILIISMNFITNIFYSQFYTRRALLILWFRYSAKSAASSWNRKPKH